ATSRLPRATCSSSTTTLRPRSYSSGTPRTRPSTAASSVRSCWASSRPSWRGPVSIESFRGLFREGRQVVIPKIQRDYAQGRCDTRSRRILSAFLDRLRRVVADPGAKSLDLDFVYGRWHEDGRFLEPLDGQ